VGDEGVFYYITIFYRFYCHHRFDLGGCLGFGDLVAVLLVFGLDFDFDLDVGLGFDFAYRDFDCLSYESPLIDEGNNIYNSLIITLVFFIHI